MSKTDEWYYVHNGQATGPVTIQQMQANARAGVLKPTDQVWREPMPNWVAAGGIMEIFSPNPAPPAAVQPNPGKPAPPPLPPMSVGYATPHPPPKDIGQDAGIRMLIPVGRSGWAIAAGYLGLLSPIPIFAPFAIIFGIVAIRDIRKHPERHGMGRAIFGIVAGALVLAVILVILGIALVDVL